MFESPRPVLVVEADLIVREYAVDIVEEVGCAALEAANADEAIAILERRGGIRVVFLDVNMPDATDGLRLCAIIRNRWPPIQLILTSGKHVHIAPASARGVFLEKPYQPDDLRQAVRKLAF